MPTKIAINQMKPNENFTILRPLLLYLFISFTLYMSYIYVTIFMSQRPKDKKWSQIWVWDRVIIQKYKKVPIQGPQLQVTMIKPECNLFWAEIIREIDSNICWIYIGKMEIVELKLGSKFCFTRNVNRIRVLRHQISRNTS